MKQIIKGESQYILSVKLPFSPAVKAGDFIFVSGQGGFQDPKTGVAIDGIEAQTKQCMENMKKILESAGASLADVVKVTVFLGSLNDFEKMNMVYKKYFPTEQPSRATAITGLVVPNMLVEMDCVAYCH